MMFKSKKNQISTDETAVYKEYMIAPGDKIIFSVYSNDGYVLVDIGIKGQESPFVSRSEIEYLVLPNGFVRLPILDTINIKGLTIKQAESMLEEKYGVYFKNPYVILSVTNRRVFVFTGSSKATVIPISDDNTTLIEVLAMAGGIPGSNKAYKIKIIRGNMSNPMVTYIDLSTIDGLKEANLSIQANDIIYVEPVYKITSSLMAELTPILALVVSLISILILTGLQ